MQLSKYRSTFRNISYNSGRMYIFGNMYIDLRSIIGVVPVHALVVGRVAGSGETYLFYP